MNKNYANTIVAFHIGRGGRFYNPGNKTYEGKYDASHISQDLYFPQRKNGKEILTGNKEMLDWNGHEVGATVSEYNKGIGTYDFDGTYDTWIFKKVKDLDEDEVRIILQTAPDDYHRFFENEKEKKKLINQLKKEIEIYVNSKEITYEDIEEFFEDKYIVQNNILFDRWDNVIWSDYDEIFDELVDILVDSY
jgi:hypothetical protein